VQFKLCKVSSVQFGQRGIPYLNTYDGRTICYPDPLIKANDTIKIDMETNKNTRAASRPCTCCFELFAMSSFLLFVVQENIEWNSNLVAAKVWRLEFI
jgi:small subunit ribosomal protein S4e